MEYSFENKNVIDGDIHMIPLSEYNFDRDESYSSRMVVSDDDDASVVRAKNTFFTSNDVVNIETFSSDMFTDTTSIVFDGAHQVTPLVQDSEETMARTRTSTKPNEKIVDGPNLPFYPNLTDDRKTPFTIRPRGTCEQNSHMNLVDKYAVRKESTERHDFNACQTSKPKDILQAMKGIHKNQFGMNLVTANPHKISDSTTTKANGIINKKQNVHEHHSQTRHDRQTLRKSPLPHKISSDDNKTNNAKMSSKVARCLPRQRSRAIAIKRSRPGEFVDTAVAPNNYIDKEPKQCDVELYDYATWRMYNRIVDHRRKNPLRVQHQEEHLQEPQHSSGTMKNAQLRSSNQAFSTSAINVHNADTMLHQSSRPQYFVRNDLLYTSDDYISGTEAEEIFDLEL